MYKTISLASTVQKKVYMYISVSHLSIKNMCHMYEFVYFQP